MIRIGFQPGGVPAGAPLVFLLLVLVACSPQPRRESPPDPGELTLAGLHTGLNLLAKLKDPPPDAALRCAAEAEGVQLSLLSDYDLTGEAPSAAGTLVLGYGSLKDEACASVGETLKKVCMAAREASVTV